MKKFINLPSPASIVVIFAPVIWLLLPCYSPGKESTCGFIILLTASYWVSGCIPMGVAGVLPVILFSATGILTLKQITDNFFFPGLWLLFGSLMLGTSVQTSGLHLRIALKILLSIGTEPKRLLLGFMLTSHLLSVFIPNLAILGMMMPIAEEVIQQLKQQASCTKSTNPTSKSHREGLLNKNVNDQHIQEEPALLQQGIQLSPK